jgi:hypothetical protein
MKQQLLRQSSCGELHPQLQRLKTGPRTQGTQQRSRSWRLRPLSPAAAIGRSPAATNHGNGLLAAQQRPQGATTTPKQRRRWLGQILQGRWHGGIGRQQHLGGHRQWQRRTVPLELVTARQQRWPHSRRGQELLSWRPLGGLQAAEGLLQLLQPADPHPRNLKPGPPPTAALNDRQAISSFVLAACHRAVRQALQGLLELWRLLALQPSALAIHQRQGDHRLSRKRAIGF